MSANGPAQPLFADFYSEDQCAQTSLHVAAQPENLSDAPGEAWHARWQLLNATLTASIQGYLVAMRDQALLAPIPFAKGRHHHFADAWNAFVAGNGNGNGNDHTLGPWVMEIVANPFNYILQMHMRTSNSPAAGPAGEANGLNGEAGAVHDPGAPSPYEKLCAKMDSGTFSSVGMGSDCASNCNRTGQRLYVDIAPGWKPRLGVPDYTHRASPASVDGVEGTSPARPFNSLDAEAGHAEVVIHAIPAPTGEMLIADWFRISERGFDSIVEVDVPKPSLETDFGKAARTAHYAKLGFMSVFVSDTGPSVIRRDDHIVFAQEDANDEQSVVGHREFSVCTDLWWASMIDRQVLTDLLATKFGRDKANAKVATLVKKHVEIIHVAPGTLYAHYATGPTGLANFECTDAKISFAGLHSPFVVLADRTLSWRYAPRLERPEMNEAAAVDESGAETSDLPPTSSAATRQRG